MMREGEAKFGAPGSPVELEEGLALTPRFDASGVIAAVATDVETGEVLMLAWMNADALERTIATGEAHFWSRSRGRLWRKGEESGNVLAVVEMRTDCDQDAVWLKVRMQGQGAACHTGRRTCFYRRIAIGGRAAVLEPVDAPRVFDPRAVYGGKSGQ
jgi:phosphoribosyl-AMP cyclohydrolase